MVLEEEISTALQPLLLVDPTSGAGERHSSQMSSSSAAQLNPRHLA